MPKEQNIFARMTDNLTDYDRITSSNKGVIEVIQVSVNRNRGKYPGGFIQVVQSKEMGDRGDPPMIVLNVPDSWKVIRRPYDPNDTGIQDTERAYQERKRKRLEGYKNGDNK